MNKLHGKISKVESHEDLSIGKINVGGINFTTIVIETAKTSDYLKEGAPVDVLFKETEVVISTENNISISLQNRVDCIIERIDTGKLISQLSLSSDIGNITSIITTNAVSQLQLKKKDKVTAMIKTNEIMLQHD